MTVAELIEKLKALPQEAAVVTRECDGDLGLVTGPERHANVRIYVRDALEFRVFPEVIEVI